MSKGQRGFLIYCNNDDDHPGESVIIDRLFRGNNGLTGRPSWMSMTTGSEFLIGDRLHESVVTQAVVDTGALRQRARFVCPRCGDDLPVRQENLDRVLEKFHASGVFGADLGILRGRVSNV